ncbi:histidinol-phosphatase, inositol monophosphatase family [Aureimonas altamirensis DSM 21988]|uniref:Histidinol-phosphatase n=2 Tax=Aureimonas altamirensis TaxID=370622 RepID=A0ABY1IN57_9HYPH|nr:histidinol-phosphatase, inositol monophosphatase family [Aureimonas altamirensis DSM 21988]
MMTMPDADFLFRIADAAAGQTLPRFRQKLAVDNKVPGAFDPVTEADRQAERAITALIEAEFPDHAILGEEFGRQGDGDALWVIDPIDGTRPFISGVPVWGTLVGLTVGGKARAGIMSQPYIGERFWTVGDGAYMDGPAGQATLHVRDVGALENATLTTTNPRMFDSRMKERFGALEDKVRLSRYGLDCYAFAMLAAGHIDLCVETGLQPYDIVALIPIIEQAGGIVTTFDGGRAENGGDVIAAATPQLHSAALAVLNG